MPTPTDLQEPTIQTLAQRHGFSANAVRGMQAAVAAGAGSMASFEHPEFGGAGQWMRGGLLMLSEPFDHELRARIDALCYDLGDWVLSQAPKLAGASDVGIRPANASAANPGHWWPAELGTPNASGAQNGLEYAYFAESRRLALRDNGGISVYDTGEHQITGIAQQQIQGQATLCFTSQLGAVTIQDLPRVTGSEAAAVPPAATSSPVSPDSSPASPSHSVLDAIERLAKLRQRGHLTDEEYEAAKKGLLARL